MKLALNVTTEIEGYWADGTANVRLALTLRNQGTIPLSDSQAVKVYCVLESDNSCGFEEVSFTLTNGFGPESEHVTMRLPMGDASSLLFDYGGESVLTLNAEVPERILGVDRSVWECYSDKTLSNEERELSCSGWGHYATVQKWENDVPVKMWATGDDRYLALLDKVIDYLTPILNLEFEKVSTKEEADFKAYVGILRSKAEDYGLEKGYYVHYGGFANHGSLRGEAVSGYVVVWEIEDREWDARTRDIAESIILHEVVHTMVPVGHTDRPASKMQGSGLKYLSPLDEALFRLNAHDLVKPDMTMDEVRSLIVFDDELLDEPQPAEPSTMQMVWRASVGLMNAGSARFKIRGGWTDAKCDFLFGVRRGPATYELVYGNFDQAPPVAHFQDGGTNIYLVWSEVLGKHQYWMEDKDGWKMVTWDELYDATYWWAWNGMLTPTLRSLINDSTVDDIAIVDRSDGTITLEAVLDETYPTLMDWEGNGLVELQLVLDDNTYAIEGYTWRHVHPHPEQCDTWEEVAQDAEVGVQVEIPEVIRRTMESP